MIKLSFHGVINVIIIIIATTVFIIFNTILHLTVNYKIILLPR